MCFMRPPKPPAAPTPPATRDGDSAEMRAREAEDRRRTRLSQGRRATILTSGTGAEGFEQIGKRATLLGQTNRLANQLGRVA